MSEMESLYRDLVLDHARTPYGQDLTGDEPGIVREVNPVCGDEVSLAAVTEGDRLTAVHWDGSGCAISMASASMLAGLAEGREVADTRSLIEEFRTSLRSRGTIPLDEERFGDAAALGGTSRYVARVKCAMLAWVILEKALDAD